jgi:hypothetical protein
MLVFKVDVEEVGDGFVVTCPDVPVLHHTIDSLWDACSVRPILAEQSGVPDDLVWLQIRARTGALTVISDVHPLHRVSFHTVIRPAHPAFDRSKLLFDYALTALRHEANQASSQERAPAHVKFILSFLNGTKVSLPRSGGWVLQQVIDDTRQTGDLSAWIRTRLTGLPASEAQWYTPVISLQAAIFSPEAKAVRRRR